MRINGFIDYGNIQNYGKMPNISIAESHDEDGLVIKKQLDINDNATELTGTSDKNTEDNSTFRDNRNILSNMQVMDIAVNKDMNRDKELIGSKSSLESLDVRKAISDMQKDKILMEYQTFVSNPELESEDGIVRKISNSKK